MVSRKSNSNTRAQAAYTCCDPPPPPEVFELDLYAILGVSIMATDDELRRSWKKRAFENHPDRHRGDPDATVRFQTIQHAYNVLKDSSRRRQYDEALLHRLYAEEYLGRFADLLLTSSGLGLPTCAEYFGGNNPEIDRLDSGRYRDEIGKHLTGETRRFFLTATVKRTKSSDDLSSSVQVSMV
jgi:curved DNA-binding protein CbpA